MGNAIMLEPVSTKEFHKIATITVGYTLTTAQPADWETNWTDYFTAVGEAIDGYTYTPVGGASAPAWTANTYWSFNNSTSQTIEINKDIDGSNLKLSGVYVKCTNVKKTDGATDYLTINHNLRFNDNSTSGCYGCGHNTNFSNLAYKALILNGLIINQWASYTGVGSPAAQEIRPHAFDLRPLVDHFWTVNAQHINANAIIEIWGLPR